MPFSSSLRDLRKQRGLSQIELAKALGVSKSAISMWECGSREPDFETLELIADYFNVDMNRLTGTKTALDKYSPDLSIYLSRLSNDPNSRMLLDVVPDATPEEVSAIAAFFKTLRGMQSDD